MMKSANRLLNYGIEGEDYIVTEDGKLGRPDGFDSSTDALDSNFWMGRNDDLELQDESWWDGTDDLISSLDKIGYDYPFENLIVDTTAIEAKQAALANVLAKYIPQLAYGQVDDPKATVDQMREELKAAGYDDVKAAIQKRFRCFCRRKMEHRISQEVNKKGVHLTVEQERLATKPGR